MSYQKILVPLDGSKLAEKVLDYLPLVAQEGGHIHLLSVISESYSIELPPLMVSTMNFDLAVTHLTPPQSSQDLNDPIVDYLDSIGNRLIQADYQVTLEIVNGDIVDSILTVANNHYDVILLATHGRTGLSKLVMGSVTEGVLHQAVCPIVVVPVHPEHIQHFPERSEQAFCVLVSLDGTPESETIVPVVEKLLAQRPAKVILLRIAHIDNVTPHVMRHHTVGEAQTELDDEFYQEANSSEMPLQHYLKRIAVRLAGTNREILTRVGNRDRVDEILFFANLYHVDLIAMATHGRSGLFRRLFGSVTESVLHHTPCPMLISHIHEHNPIISDAAPSVLTSK